MKSKFIFLLLIIFSPTAMSGHHRGEAALKDIKETLGMVPEFYKNFSDETVSAAWEQMKAIQLSPKTALTGMEKELIGLAVASQIPCSYCAYFHTKAAKFNGADEERVNEAIELAADSRFWATNFDGLQVDFNLTKKEVDQVAKFVKKKLEEKAPAPIPIEITDAESAFKDIEREWGLVPSVIKRLPKAAIPSAWKELKGIYLSPTTALPAKIKVLICLAVESQIPSTQLVYWNTEMAKVLGITDQEVAEAVNMAAITRFWSTWLNGKKFGEKNFKKEVDKIFSYLEKKKK